LIKKEKWDELQEIQAIAEMANIHYIRQKEPKGLGHAIWCARAFIGYEPFILHLGDNLIQESLINLKRSLETGQANSSIMLAEVNNPQDYGIAEVKDDRIIHLEEKQGRCSHSDLDYDVHHWRRGILPPMHGVITGIYGTNIRQGNR
jgi:dTDP-glucose pyrophosphorylase